MSAVGVGVAASVLAYGIMGRAAVPVATCKGCKLIPELLCQITSTEAVDATVDWIGLDQSQGIPIFGAGNVRTPSTKS